MKEVKRLKSGLTEEEQSFWESVLGTRFRKGARKRNSFFPLCRGSCDTSTKNAYLGAVILLDPDKNLITVYFTVPKEFV